VETLLGFTPPDFVLKAIPQKIDFNGSAFVLVANASFYPTTIGVTGSPGEEPASGYLDFYLRETETSGQLISFNAIYTGDGVYREVPFYPVLIPNQDSVLLSDLLTPILNST
jgi:hypothetical protein